MTPQLTFADYLQSLGPLSRGRVMVDSAAQHEIRAAVAAVAGLSAVDRAALTALVAQEPDCVPVLALAVAVSQERLRNLLKYRFGTSSHRKAAREDPAAVVDFLDDEFGIVEEFAANRHRTFDFADVLIARASTRQTAGAAIGRGRSVEDAIEEVARSLGLPYELRTRFTGRGGRSAPCDLAIPAGGDAAQIVCAAKAFDSTGSKLTDAPREIIEMAEVRLPRQYVFAVVDGIGWLNREADLRRFYEMWERDEINGLYSLALLDVLAKDLDDAATRLGIDRNA
jgi:hypothetical protein